MPVTADELQAFVAVHCELLKGVNVRNLSELGELARVLANTSGWRPDAVVESSRMLRELLDAYLFEQPAFRHPLEDVRDAVSLIWGLSGAVHSSDAAAAVIVTAHDGKTVDRWEKRIIEGSVDWAATNFHRFVSIGGPPPDDPGTMADWRKDPANWPQDPQLAEWLRESRKHLSSWLLPQDPNEDLPPVVEQALRTLIADDFMADVAGRGLGSPVRVRTPSTGDEWRKAVEERDLLRPTRRDLPERRRRKISVESHVSYCAVQPWREIVGIRLDGDDLRAHEISDDGAHRRAAARLLLRTGYQLVERRNFGRRLNERIQEIENRRRNFGIAAPRTAKRVWIRASVDRAPHLVSLQNVDLPLSGDWCLEASEAVYALQPPESARDFCLMYLEKRERYDEDQPWRRTGFGIADGDEIEMLAIADFNIHLKMVDINMPVEAARLQRCIDRRGSRYPLHHLAKRNEALFHSKARRHGAAADLIEDAYLEALDSGGRDPVRRLETMHQIALSASAISAKYVEDRLQSVRPGERAVLAQSAQAALLWSNRLSNHLHALRARFDDNLPSTRLGDRRRIVWGDWETTAAQTSLRILIDVQTALASGLVTTDELKLAGVDFGIERALSTYRELVAANSFGRNGGVRNIGMQATWLGFLNGGVIPYEPRVNSQLHDVAFVEGDPFAAMGDEPTIDLDVLASARWHLENADPGNLGRLERESAAWVALDTSAPGAFNEWWMLMQPLVAEQLTPMERARRHQRPARFEVQLNANNEPWRTPRPFDRAGPTDAAPEG